MSDAVPDLKSIVRKDALIRRDAIPAAERAQAAEAIAARGFPLAIKPGAIVSGFMPLKTEINPLPLMRKLEAAGAHLALPAIAGRGKPLIMRAFAFGDALASGQWVSASRTLTHRKSPPTSCSFRCSPSTERAIASATAPATTT